MTPKLGLTPPNVKQLPQEKREGMEGGAWHLHAGRDGEKNCIRPKWGSEHGSHHVPHEYSRQELAVVQLVTWGHPAGTKHNDLSPILVIS